MDYMNIDYKAQREHFFTGFANGFGKKKYHFTLI